MTDDQTPQQSVNERINVYISPGAKAMMEEMGRALYPALKRSGGVIVDTALREMYQRFRDDKSKKAAA
jgi:hypothetical protein